MNYNPLTLLKTCMGRLNPALQCSGNPISSIDANPTSGPSKYAVKSSGLNLMAL